MNTEIRRRVIDSMKINPRIPSRADACSVALMARKIEKGFTQSTDRTEILTHVTDDNRVCVVVDSGERSAAASFNSVFDAAKWLLWWDDCNCIKR